MDDQRDYAEEAAVRRDIEREGEQELAAERAEEPEPMEASIVQKVEQALDALGTDPAAVAATLVREGCTGKRDTGEACPVYNYLDSRFRGLVGEVDGDTVWLNERAGYDAVPMPDAVQEFISAFDGGEYDELAVAS